MKTVAPKSGIIPPKKKKCCGTSQFHMKGTLYVQHCQRPVITTINNQNINDRGTVDAFRNGEAMPLLNNFGDEGLVNGNSNSDELNVKAMEIQASKS